MDLTLTPELTAFREEVRAFLDAHKDEHEAGAPKDPKAWQRLLIDNGYAARTIPRSYGGFGAEPDGQKTRIIAEAFIAAGAPRGMSGQGISMLVPTLLEVGSEEQKTRWIPPTLSGEIIWCQGYSEPGAGSDLANLQTKAVEDGEDFLISGSKIWTSTAAQAQMMFCLVRTEATKPKHEGISYVLFPMDTPGIEVRPLKTMTGQAEFNEVFFTDVRVPQANVVGGRGRGWQVANTTLKHERGMLGDPNATEARLKQLIELMKSETVDGRPIIDNAIFRDRLMQLQARVLSMKFNGLRTMTDDTAGLARLVVKLQGCELNHQVAALAIDALGELGILYQEGPHLRAKGRWQWNYMFDLGLIIGGGTAQIQKNIISERGLGMPREPKTVEA
ncbi:MAG: acyl-CoA dehydrogenase family protein [Alphaproteobacteria bacterium]|nr:acyl-CoA dehydrogenase family protein [Alphaproteobacteria bacterium]MBU1515863.1 acyl-CoA dehydrogenase family protein [Alphaproteobacteria bacterium]MBU2094085.1 acyl-CoA dehydrogenase family protein [Alphaproteobacteria bacterium]MBU2151437.1 acyl-CoA dehydrogenase family protein [Alphaproteobacteria bacterium]MBU2305287.1 acyl-CoA dehydrogenase family protein [Alphaproteobacteria bacterium]